MDRSLTLVNRVSRLELCLPATDGRSENAETEKHGRRTAGKTTATRRIPVHTPAAAAAAAKCLCAVCHERTVCHSAYTIT